MYGFQINIPDVLASDVDKCAARVLLAALRRRPTGRRRPRPDCPSACVPSFPPTPPARRRPIRRAVEDGSAERIRDEEVKLLGGRACKRSGTGDAATSTVTLGQVRRRVDPLQHCFWAGFGVSGGQMT